MKEFLLKYKFAVAAIVLVIVGAAYYFTHRCEPASYLDKKVAAIPCMMELMMGGEQLMTEVCKEIGREAQGCQFQDEDQPKIELFLQKKFLQCVNTKLAINNKCPLKSIEELR